MYNKRGKEKLSLYRTKNYRFHQNQVHVNIKQILSQDEYYNSTVTIKKTAQNIIKRQTQFYTRVYSFQNKAIKEEQKNNIHKDKEEKNISVQKVVTMENNVYICR